MLKTNTAMTFLCTALLGLLCWLGKGIWDDVAAIKVTNVNTAAQVQTLQRTEDDHETRIRQNERDITILQQQHEERATARSPKMNDNNKP